MEVMMGSKGSLDTPHDRSDLLNDAFLLRCRDVAVCCTRQFGNIANQKSFDGIGWTKPALSLCCDGA